ncbi:MAG: hypothetical protein ACFB15_04455 [Cyclobacteriaceae bacterium]
MKALTNQEQRIVQHLIEIGYNNAASSFSSLVKQPVTIEALCFEIAETSTKVPITYQDGNMTLVTTDIMGEAGGRSYLLLSESECSALQGVCAPSISDEEQRKVMQEAIVKEIDNILSAAVLTEFSNALDLHVFGGVPHLFILPRQEMKGKIEEDFAAADDGYCLTANTRFLLEENTQLQPQFFWRLTTDFLHRIEKYVATNL